MKILVITSKSLERVDGGDTKRIIELTEVLRDHFGSKCQVDIVTSTNAQTENLRQYQIAHKTRVRSYKSRGYLSLFSYFYLLCFQYATLQTLFFWSRNKTAYIKQNYANYDLIIIHHLRNLIHLRDIKSHSSVVLELTDSISMTYEQLFDDGKFSFRKLVFWLESLFVKRAERLVCAANVKISLISDVDAKYFMRKFSCPESIIGVIPNRISVVNNSCRFNIQAETKKSLLFIGAFSSLQNQSGFEWFYSNVYLPNSALHKFLLVLVGKGSSKYESFTGVKTYEYIERFEDIVVQANVLCGIAPLLIAGGQQNKIIDYIEAGVPCVSTFQATKWLSSLGVQLLEATNDPDVFGDLILSLEEAYSAIYFDQLEKLKTAEDYYFIMKDSYLTSFINDVVKVDT